jgi:hypothetical protein
VSYKNNVIAVAKVMFFVKDMFCEMVEFIEIDVTEELAREVAEG